MLHVHVHVNAACPTACPYCISSQHILTAMLRVHAAFPCMSKLSVRATCICCMSMPHAQAVWFCMPLLHVHAVCPCFMPHDNAAWHVLVACLRNGILAVFDTVWGMGTGWKQSLYRSIPVSDALTNQFILISYTPLHEYFALSARQLSLYSIPQLTLLHLTSSLSFYCPSSPAY